MLVQATGPEDVNVDRVCTAKALVRARIVAGEKAGLAQNGLRLDFSFVVDEDAGSDGAAIGFHTFQLILIQFALPVRSSRNSDGGSFRLMTSTMSPSSSKSPKAQP